MENVVLKELEKSANKYAVQKPEVEVPNCDPVLTVYGIAGIENIKTRECVTSYVDEGESVLLTLNINSRQYKVRVLKEHPYVGIMVSGHSEIKATP